MQTLIFAAILFCPFPCEAGADSFKTFSTPRFTLHIGATRSSHLSKNPHVDGVAEHSIKILNKTYEELTRIFDAEPKNRVVLRFLTPDEFREATGSPPWTSAMYFAGEISIPISPEGTVDLGHLRRALRHEYVHAVIAELSESRCPAWLDEGIAQLIEGKPNPLLGPALRDWIEVNEAMSFRSLRHGFTLLDERLVPAAYAQSLFATRNLVNRRGFQSIRKYLKLLREGEAFDVAFKKAFGQDLTGFEMKLSSQIRRWAETPSQHP